MKTEKGALFYLDDHVPFYVRKNKNDRQTNFKKTLKIIISLFLKWWKVQKKKFPITQEAQLTIWLKSGPVQLPALPIFDGSFVILGHNLWTINVKFRPA